MAVTVDARGLSCPQPVILTINEIKTGTESEITVLVDTETSQENVSRAAVSHGCTVAEVTETDEGYSILIKKEK